MGCNYIRNYLRFATMTSDEMASDEMKKQREKFTKEVHIFCDFIIFSIKISLKNCDI